MGVTVWYFVERDSGDLERIPAARVRRFFDGAEALAEDANPLRILEVILNVEQRTVALVQRVSWLLFKRTETGHRDGQHRERAMRLAARQLGLDYPALPDNVESIDKHLAQQQTRLEHRWTPSEEQIQQVANLLNAAAGKPPVVVIQAMELIPV